MMITFPETIDAAERLAELLKSASDLGAALRGVGKDLEEFENMLAYSHQKQFENVEEALSYIDKVLVPQILRIRDSLHSGSEGPLKRLNIASEQAERLAVRLRMMTDDSAMDLFK
ncbi:MAG: hypothetical protein GTO14_06235 [Anaerolineales bacterium]|nr:hypothetical protein [Anaerolineales bacterium]